MVEVLHEERLETLALSSMKRLTIGMRRFPLNLSCSSHSPISSSVLMSLKFLIRLVQTSDTVDYDMDLKLDGDHIEVLALQTTVTVLKSQSESSVWNFGSQLKHRCSLSLKFLVFCTVDVGLEFK